MVLREVGCVSEEENGLGFKPVGGMVLRNRKNEVVGWVKGKDPDGGQSFALCLFRPELADSQEMRTGLEDALRMLKEFAARAGFPLFDMADFESEMRRTFDELGVNPEEYVRYRRTEDMTFRLMDLATGRRVEVVFGMRPVRRRRRRKRAVAGAAPTLLGTRVTGKEQGREHNALHLGNREEQGSLVA
jgi:hypothetical protein